MYMYHAFSDVLTEKMAGLNYFKSNTDFYEIVRRVFKKDDKDHDKVSGKVDGHKTYTKRHLLISDSGDKNGFPESRD